MKQYEICKNNSLQSITKFNSCLQFLILTIKHNNKVKINFKYTDKIELNNYITIKNKDSSKYKLISSIKNTQIEKELKERIKYRKSRVNNE